MRRSCERNDWLRALKLTGKLVADDKLTLHGIIEFSTFLERDGCVHYYLSHGLSRDTYSVGFTSKAKCKVERQSRRRKGSIRPEAEEEDEDACCLGPC